MNCKICSSPSEFFASAVILNKHEIKYYRCTSCGFLQTEDPFWLSESYTEAINRSDVGMVKRNLQLAEITKQIITSFFNKHARFIDYGAGYGLFVRLMRDKGFDFYWFDKFCKNIFAQDFEAKESQQFEVLSAFEVFEHLEEPIAELEQMLKFSKNILFSTELMPPSYPKPGEWWYYGLDHGQHIAIYTPESLKRMASRFGLNYYTNGKNIHLITEKKVSPFWFRLISFYPIASFLNFFIGGKSLHEQDYNSIIAAMKAQSGNGK